MPDFPRGSVVVKTFGHPRVVPGPTQVFGVEPPFSLTATYKRRASIKAPVDKLDITFRVIVDEPKTRYERDEVV